MIVADITSASNLLLKISIKDVYAVILLGLIFNHEYGGSCCFETSLGFKRTARHYVPEVSASINHIVLTTKVS
jgi:hypothetical protein